jgi:Reverse transcriptase (RNA-dependent DNA polymerase)
MDEEALTIVQTPFALEIHNEAGKHGLWKAIHERRLAAFMAERGTAQGDVMSLATWMCLFDILLTMLELVRLTNRCYIRHGSEISPVKLIAYADDLLAVMADVEGLQQVSREVSGFCGICNLTILPAKLRTYYHNFGEGKVDSAGTLITYHGSD